ncbi:MAG: MFS family permease [Alphaproteobacteria bacterium]|jgi:MFS family permease
MSTVTPSAPQPRQRDLNLSYAAGFMGLGLMDAYVFIVPLWAVLIGASATQVGLLVGARSMLPFLFTIHGGVLMDRYGPRPVMITFIFLIILMVPLYPLLPWFVPLFALQLITGFALTMQWVGAQTIIANLSRGDAGYLGYFSFATRLGTFIAPIIFGLLWDLTTPWVCFISIAAWAALMLVLTLAIQKPNIDSATKSSAESPPQGGRIRALLPRLSDYRETLALAAIPAVAISIGACFLRNSTSGVQGSIYVVYLHEIALTGTLIGILFAAIEGASGIGSLIAGRVAKHFSPFAMLVGTTAAAIALMAATPLLGGVVALLILFQVARGIIQGINQPVMFSVQSKAVPRNRQGATVALRVTVNRLSSIIVPPIMGLIADTYGISHSFLILGAVFLLLTGVLWLFARRMPEAANT